MGNESYEQLADALDTLPGGFPRTPSGVEIKIIKKAFTEEEAELASKLSRNYETVAEIARRINKPETQTKELLDNLLPRQLIRQRSNKGQEEYRLGPFVVGWWEAMMGQWPDDREFAALTQQYIREGGGERIMSPRPGLLGVVPARGSLKPELLQPYDDIDAHFARYERFYVEDCVCRIEHNLLGSSCKKPVTRCAFVGLPSQTPLSDHVLDREQAIKLFSELEEQGHVHLGFYGFIATAESPQFVGCCNCCGDCCGILTVINDLGFEEGPQRSNYRAVIDSAECIACGDCIERCQVHAISEADGTTILDRDRCIGCGLCVITCSSNAISQVPVSAEEWFDVPSSFEDWEERRLQSLESVK